MPTRAKFMLFAVAATAVAILFMSRTEAQGPASPSSRRCEVAIIKWDGPDRVQFILPEKSEMVRVFKQGVEMPKDIREEAFCLAWAANQLAREGWEPVNLNSTRILMQRQVAP